MRLKAASVAPAGTLRTRLNKPWPTVLRDERHLALLTILAHTLPWFGHSAEVNLWRVKNIPNVWRGLWRALVAGWFGIPTQFGALWITRLDKYGNRTPFGLASLRVVTTVGAGYLVDALQGLVEPEDMKFHAYGTGNTAEAVGNTALVTELTTEYATNSIRPTGSQTEASATAYRTVATLDPDSDVAIVEHGLLSDADVGQGVLLDRSVFAAINVTGADGSSLQTTYDFTITAGS